MSELTPNVAVLKTDGINCDKEMAHAFRMHGGDPEIVHINQLREGDRKLADYQILAIPGGFSYGDDVASGRVLAVELTSYLPDQVQDFVDDGKPVIGVCNGFQTLANMGLLPNKTIGEQQVTLTHNKSGSFVCKWVDLIPEATVCKFAGPSDFEELPIPMQIAHGEGNFEGSEDTVIELVERGQVVFRYLDNPNGSMEDIAAICDPSGLILGMMPHPERSIEAFHPHRVRTAAAKAAAAVIFNNMINYAKEM